MVQRDSLRQNRGNGRSSMARVLPGDPGQLLNESKRSLPAGPILRDNLDRLSKTVAQIQDDEHRTHLDIPADGQPGAVEENTDLE